MILRRLRRHLAVTAARSTQGLEGFDICESRTRNADGHGFDSHQVHALRRCPMALTEEQEKELDEMAKRFKDTKGGK